MKQPYSLNMVNQDGRIDIDTLSSVPPGCEKLKITGILSLQLKINYISKPNCRMLFKTKLWGREQQDLTFRRINENQAVLNLSIRSSLQNLSKYFSDMGVICIQCYISGRDDQKEPLRSQQFTYFGRIYISIKRYIVSFLLCEFEEAFSILDQRKTKIGEVVGKLSIQQSRKESFYPIATQPEIRHDRFQSINISNRPSHDYSPNQVIKNDERKDSLRPSEFERRQIGRLSLQEQEGKRNTVVDEYISRPESNLDEFPWKTDRRKGKAAIFLQEYNRNKPEHTQLSLITSKYGFNCPSIEVMKLKLDEATLLSDHEQTGFEDGARINLLLKSIKNYSKIYFDSLIISYQKNQQQLKTQTKIILNEQINNKIDINYLYVLQKVKGEDSLIFQVKDLKIEINIADLKGKNSLDLKAKNGKKMATLQFSFVLEQFLSSSNNIPSKQTKEDQQNAKKELANKIKENCFLKVEGWPKGHVMLRNKKIGLVNGPKIMYQIENEDQSFIQVELQASNERHFLKININHILKQQNFVIDGKQVKIITAKGELTDLLALVEKIDSISNKTQKIEKPQKSQEQSVEIKDIVNVFEYLEKCQNQQCNEIIQSLSKQLNLKKLEKLSKLIGISFEIFEKIIVSVFQGNFHRFYKNFLTYHSWNHRYLSSQRKVAKIIENNFYINDLQKTLKRLKRSGQVVFGIIASFVFMSEFLKCGQRPTTEQTQSQFNQEQLGKLIILLFERYPTKCIKISELQSFINNPHKNFHLNTYLLTKMAQEIINDSQSFQNLSSSDWELIDILRNDCDGEWGLAKLILTNEQQMANSSMISQIETDRRVTDPIQSNEEQGQNKTDPSKEQEKKERQEAPHLITEPEPIKENITIIVSDIIIPDVDLIEEIEIFSENEGIKLARELINFPRAIELIKDSTNTVIVTTSHQNFEGVFIANTRPQKIKLFNNGVEAGVMSLFSQQKSHESNGDEQIIVRIEDMEIKPLPNHDQSIEQRPQTNEIKCIAPIAKSPFVKLTIRSIRPTRSNYRLAVISETQRKTINFPNQNEILLKNSNEGWKMRMVDQQVEDIIITNHLASNPYCFIENRDQRVAFTAVIEIEQCWDPEISLGLKQSLHLIVHFDQLLCIKDLVQGEYSFIIQCEPKMANIHFHNNDPNSKINIYQSVVAQSPPERVTIKLINTLLRQEVAEFRFTLKLIDEGTVRNERYLMSSSKGYRLKITIFQVRHSWEYCKPDRVIALFNSENRRVIQSWIRSISHVTEEQLTVWLKANFQLSLSQISILLEELLKRISHGSVEAFLDTFRRPEKALMENLSEIKEQFTVFDYNDEGIVSDEQLRIAKKVFNRNFKPFYTFLLQNQSLFIPSPELLNNFIIDLSPAIKSNCFDYLSFLNLMEGRNERNDSNPKVKQVKEKQDEKVPLKGANMSIRIQQFSNLSINKLPCTFLFKVNDQILADPIHKCYSFKYTSSNQIVIPNYPPPQLQIYLQSLKANGSWEYKLLQTIPLSEQVKVFGGLIKFSIERTDRKKSEGNEMFPKRQRIHNQNRNQNGNKFHQTELKTSPYKAHEFDRSFSESMNKQFEKSIWNKKLSQTKQKWSEWRQRRGQRQIKRSGQYDKKVQMSEEQY